MKRIMLIAALGFSLSTLNAQLQKGSVLIGADIANFDLSLNKGNYFSMQINPKSAWFIQDNLAIGGYLNFGLTTSAGAGNDITYGIGPLARYYISDDKINVIRHTRFFAEANAGIEGASYSQGNNTTGLGIGIGPGVAYFISPNIGLELLLKYNGIIGFGSTAYVNSLNLNFGFQIYLPDKKIKSTFKNPGNQ